MTLQDIIRLVKSLSASEKRHLKISSRKQAGSKDYLKLYAIIEANSGDVKTIRLLFAQQHPASSLNNTIQYLGKIIIECLVETKTEKDNFFQLLQQIMAFKVLQERSLHEEGLSRLQKIRKSAQESQQHWIEYFTYRKELDHLSEKDFYQVTDNTLVGLQMKAKEVIKNLNHIQDHHALFELLKYRLIHSGKIASEDERKKMNDLMLSEMTLVAGKTKNSFLSNKLHLLFQSFFFMDIGDYQTALKTFHSLNKLFEENIDRLDYPPMDYLATLNGIMDSLHTLKKTGDILYYVDKAAQLDRLLYPEYFRYHVRKTIAVYRLVVLVSEKRYPDATAYISGLDQSVLKMYNPMSEEKQWELYFYCSVVYLKQANWKKAHHFILQVMQHEKEQPQMLIYKAVRLLNMIIYYEAGDSAYLPYEIRSYKRYFSKKHALLVSEKLLLRLLGSSPDKNRKRLPIADKRKLMTEVDIISGDKYEQQLLKYFDFVGWVKEKLEK